MKRVFPAALTALLLSACPDSRVPKPPPRVPEPKVVSSTACGQARIPLLAQAEASTRA